MTWPTPYTAPHRRVRARFPIVFAAVVGVAAAAMGGSASGAAPSAVAAASEAAAAAGWRAPAYVTTIGHPGHAGVYAWGAATATDGTILVGDYWNYVLRRYAPSGELLQTIGGRGNGPGQNQAPHGVAVDPATGDIFVADPNGNHEIDRFDAAGTYLNSIGLAPHTAYGLYVTHLAVGPDGLIYATNSHNLGYTFAEVLVYAPDGTFVRAFGTQGPNPGQMGLVRGIAVSAAGEVYLADAGHQQIEVFTTDGTWVRSFGKGYFRGDMRGSAIDEANGFYYVNDAATSQVEKFRLDGTWVASLGTEGTGLGQFRDGGRELTVAGDGTLYAPDYGNNRVNTFAADGTFQQTFPDPPQEPAPDGLNQPQGLGLSGDGTVLDVADTYNHRVVRYDALTGAFIKNWGFRGTTDPLAMNYPRDVASDPVTREVFLMNSRQAQVKRYGADGTFLTSWGQLSADPGGISIARGIVAQGGKVYVLDGPISRVSIFKPDGTFLSMFDCGVYDPGMMSGCNGLAIAATGVMYAACIKENAICVFDKSGVLLRKMGMAQLKSPYDVALYKGKLYVASANRIDVMTTTGVRVGTFANVGGVTPHKVGAPRGIAISPTGRMYVLDSLNEHVDVFQIE